MKKQSLAAGAGNHQPPNQPTLEAVSVEVTNDRNLSRGGNVRCETAVVIGGMRDKIGNDRLVIKTLALGITFHDSWSLENNVFMNMIHQCS